MKKIIYFDVEEYEKEFLIKSNEGKFDYRLIESPLNNLLKIEKKRVLSICW